MVCRYYGRRDSNFITLAHLVCHQLLILLLSFAPIISDARTIQSYPLKGTPRSAKPPNLIYPPPVIAFPVLGDPQSLRGRSVHLKVNDLKFWEATSHELTRDLRCRPVAPSPPWDVFLLVCLRGYIITRTFSHHRTLMFRTWVTEG